MSPWFQFKSFTVHHDRCAMKVGTDAILLGSWATSAGRPRTALDIGTGSGIIALMLAQRFSDAHIEAVEIDPTAANQAAENFQASSWASRLTVVHRPIQQYDPQQTFDMIVCNPPFFSDSVKPEQPARIMARHNDGLPSSELVSAAQRLLSQRGRFSVIVPADDVVALMMTAKNHHLQLTRQRLVRPTPKHPPKRALLEFSKQAVCDAVKEPTMCIEQQRHEYSSEYTKLARDFLLKMEG